MPKLVLSNKLPYKSRSLEISPILRSSLDQDLQEVNSNAFDSSLHKS